MHATQVSVRQEQPPQLHLRGILKMWILVTGDRDQVSGACGWGAKTQTLKIFNKIFAAAKEAASTSVLKPSVQFWDAWLPASQHLGAWGAAGGVLEGPGNQAYRRQMPQKGPWGPLNPAFSSKYKTSVPRNVLHNFPWLSEKSWFHTVIWKPLQSKTELPVFNAYLPKLQMCFLASDCSCTPDFQLFPPVVGLTRENRPSPQAHRRMKWGCECKMHIRFWRLSMKKRT